MIFPPKPGAARVVTNFPRPIRWPFGLALVLGDVTGRPFVSAAMTGFWSCVVVTLESMC